MMDNVLAKSRLILHCYYHPFLILKGQLSKGVKVYHLFPLPSGFYLAENNDEFQEQVLLQINGTVHIRFFPPCTCQQKAR